MWGVGKEFFTACGGEVFRVLFSDQYDGTLGLEGKNTGYPPPATGYSEKNLKKMSQMGSLGSMACEYDGSNSDKNTRQAGGICDDGAGATSGASDLCAGPDAQ